MTKIQMGINPKRREEAAVVEVPVGLKRKKSVLPVL
jgi:hypothetical protein